MEVPKELSEKAKGRQPFYHNSNLLDSKLDQLIYEWEQSLEEIDIYIKPPDFVLPAYQAKCREQGIPVAKLKIEIKPKSLAIGVDGNPPFINVDLGILI